MVATMAIASINKNSGWLTSYTYTVGDPALFIDGGAAFSGEQTTEFTGAFCGSGIPGPGLSLTVDNSDLTTSP